MSEKISDEQLQQSKALVAFVANALAEDEFSIHAFAAGDSRSGWMCLAMAAIDAVEGFFGNPGALAAIKRIRSEGQTA